MKKAIIASLFMLGITLIYSFTYQQPKTDWGVPAEYKNKKNPVVKTESIMTLGKQTFNKYCAGCHGLTGNGDGEKAKSLANVKPVNLALADIKGESDGEHFYKIKYGKDYLHSFKGKIDDEAIWAIVHYMRTFNSK